MWQQFELQFVQFCLCNSTSVHACIVLMKQHFLLWQMGFFLDFFAQLGQLWCIIFPIYRLPISQVINEDDSVCIRKNRSHHLTAWLHHLRLLRSWFTWCCPLFQLFLCLRRVMMDPSFINSYVSIQKFTRIATEKRETKYRVGHTVAFTLEGE